jgi:hypothetical protein
LPDLPSCGQEVDEYRLAQFRDVTFSATRPIAFGDDTVGAGGQGAGSGTLSVPTGPGGQLGGTVGLPVVTPNTGPHFINFFG